MEDKYFVELFLFHYILSTKEDCLVIPCGGTEAMPRSKSIHVFYLYFLDHNIIALLVYSYLEKVVVLVVSAGSTNQDKIVLRLRLINKSKC